MLHAIPQFCFQWKRQAQLKNEEIKKKLKYYFNKVETVETKDLIFARFLGAQLQQVVLIDQIFQLMIVFKCRLSKKCDGLVMDLFFANLINKKIILVSVYLTLLW